MLRSIDFNRDLEIGIKVVRCFVLVIITDLFLHIKEMKILVCVRY